MNGPAIEAHDLWKDFGAGPVLQDLSLHVGQGEIYGLIGPSGSGKSTTILLLNGRLRPSRGEIRVLGERPVKFSVATRRRIGYMPQSFVLYPELTVQQNVAFIAGLYGEPEWRSREATRGVLELVELWDAREQEASTLSGGQRRRLALAAALVHDPDLLFADEPTANIDPILRANLWSHFRSRARRGQTLLITTQYIDEAEYCDRVGLLFNGALIAEGRPEDLRREAFGGDVIDVGLVQPSDEYRRVLETLKHVVGIQSSRRNDIRVTVQNGEVAIPVLVDTLEEAGARILTIAPYSPTFDEVFIRLIQKYERSAVVPSQARAGPAGEA